ncbi:UvrD-helicase domain-containing protein [Stackebrandtia soli]|uniref:UvrD-helicase domain-containing protein n=1 Tax=Stackebrandtia soli TaxID=1892856 RepID=UPI0039EA9232
MGSTHEPSALFDLPAGARVPRRGRGAKPRALKAVTYVPMPDPIVPQRPNPRAPDGPCLAGMEEVGTGILDNVDAMQRVAASAPPGPLLINAGPGTGKTHVLVRRIAYLVTELNVPASQCLVLAATPHAVALIETRLRELVGDACDDMTFAAFGELSAPPPLGHLFVDDLHLMDPKLYQALRADRGDAPAFTATGDPDSSVLTEPVLFEWFPEDFPDARVVRLTRNHRSTAPIIAAVMQLITPTTRAPGRQMMPTRPTAGTAPIGRYYATSIHDEQTLADRLRDRLAPLGVDASEVAVIGPGWGDADELAGRQYRVVYCASVTREHYPDTANARRSLFVAMSRAADLLYVSHSGTGSPLLDAIDSGLFTPFGRVVSRGPRAEQPRLL